jgi:hypothetical protein
MIAETCIGYLDKVVIKSGLVHTLFVSADEHDGLLEAVERKGEPPQSVLPKSELFIFGNDEPLSVSTFGRPKLGPNAESTFNRARSSS